MNKKTITKELGLEAEKQFEIECIIRNIPIYKSVGITQSDYVISLNDELLKVQVKSTDSIRNDGYTIRCSWGQYRNGWKYYTKKETDIIAVYIRIKKEWYIIPVEEVSEKLGFYISDNGKFNKFKNNWNNSIINEDNDSIEKNKKILELSELNKSIREISLETGYGKGYISSILKLNNKNLKSRMNNITNELLKELYFEKNLTMLEIADEVNLSLCFIRRKFREFGIKTKKQLNTNLGGPKSLIK